MNLSSMLNSYKTRQKNCNFATLGLTGYENRFYEMTGITSNVDMKKMSGLGETVAKIKLLAQDTLIGKFIEINCPMGF